jgi:hypothetical protein
MGCRSFRPIFGRLASHLHVWHPLKGFAALVRWFQDQDQLGSREAVGAINRPRPRSETHHVSQIPHIWRVALTIARIPALTASGRVSHAFTTWVKSSGKVSRCCCTHVTHFECMDVSFWYGGIVRVCCGVDNIASGNVLIRWEFSWVCAVFAWDVFVLQEVRSRVRDPCPAPIPTPQVCCGRFSSFPSQLPAATFYVGASILSHVFPNLSKGWQSISGVVWPGIRATQARPCIFPSASGANVCLAW